MFQRVHTGAELQLLFWLFICNGPLMCPRELHALVHHLFSGEHVSLLCMKRPPDGTVENIREKATIGPEPRISTLVYYRAVASGGGAGGAAAPPPEV